MALYAPRRVQPRGRLTSSYSDESRVCGRTSVAEAKTSPFVHLALVAIWSPVTRPIASRTICIYKSDRNLADAWMLFLNLCWQNKIDEATLLHVGRTVGWLGVYIIGYIARTPVL